MKYIVKLLPALKLGIKLFTIFFVITIACFLGQIILDMLALDVVYPSIIIEALITPAILFRTQFFTISEAGLWYQYYNSLCFIDLIALIIIYLLFFIAIAGLWLKIRSKK